MRRRLLGIVAAVALIVAGGVVAQVNASPAEEYTGTHFGDGNIPIGCENDRLVKPDGSYNAAGNECFHMRTDMNGLDSPQVDVLIMVPASPVAERDARIMRQVVEMWQGGIQTLAPQMGLEWLGDGMKFHISVDIVDTANGAPITTYPIADPEIVVLATNTQPFAHQGIGIDPLKDGALAVTGVTSDEGPCHGVANPFAIETWENMPGFQQHDGERGGTYTEDCGGAGGNICFAINNGGDLAPDTADLGLSFFDLVAHEFGHCLTIGHVGDGQESKAPLGEPWGKLPTNDIMAYNTDPPGLNKCVSTLDVEGIATTQSRYLDANGDGVVTPADKLDANDQAGDGSNPFQTQHPRDHLYASGTGSPLDCPQPDLGVVRGEKTDWTPDAVSTSAYALNVDSPSDGASSSTGDFTVSGSVAKSSTHQDPTETSVAYEDAADDGTTPFTQITSLYVETTPTDVNATLHLESVPPTDVPSATVYTLVVDGHRFDSSVFVPGSVELYDVSGQEFLPAGASTWDTTTNTVTFSIARSRLTAGGVDAPYYVSSEAAFGTGLLTAGVPDDYAPDKGTTLGVGGDAGMFNMPLLPGFAESPSEVPFYDDSDNTFYADQSSLGQKRGTPVDPSRNFTLEISQPSNVSFVLNWSDNDASADLDLRVTGSGFDSDTTAAGSNKPEATSFSNVPAGTTLNLNVDPFLISDEIDGVTYTLTAVVTPLVTATDRDGDGVPDDEDLCPDQAAEGPDGCPLPPRADELVRVSVDGAQVAQALVTTAGGPASFSLPVSVADGTHTLTIAWQYYGRVVASKSVRVTHTEATTTSTSTTTTSTTTTVAPHDNGNHGSENNGNHGSGNNGGGNGHGASGTSEWLSDPRTVGGIARGLR